MAASGMINYGACSPFLSSQLHAIHPRERGRRRLWSQIENEDYVLSLSAALDLILLLSLSR